jgi:type II secretory pathway component PulF
MEALVRGGVPMELALSEAATIAGNAAFRAAVLRARDRVMKGEPLSAAFRAQGEFPRYMAVWVALGESTGQVDRVFAQVACYFRGDIDRRGAYFLALVEPALILLVGGAVLFFVLFFIVPLFGMYGSIF